MELNPKRRNKALSVTFGLILLAVVLALVAPEEQTLGSYIRLIYIHAAVTWVGLGLFAASGLFALVYFLGAAVPTATAKRIKDSVLAWSSASQLTAILFWATSVAFGAVSAYLTWGGRWWIEPRMRVAVFILLLALVIFQMRGLLAEGAWQAALNLGLPVLSLFMLVATGKLVHPNNAFAGSEAVDMKLFVGAITLTFVAVAVVVTRLFSSGLRDRQAGAELASERLAN